MINKQHIIDRFVSYITIDTKSDPDSNTTPSTKKQWDLANKLVFYVVVNQPCYQKQMQDPDEIKS